MTQVLAPSTLRTNVKPASMIQRNRRLEFDLIRVVMIVNSVILHFNNRFDLEFIAYPPGFVRSRLFHVGSFFLFTAGYMAYQIYLPRMKQDSRKTTLKLVRKGCQILGVYLAYVVLLRLATGSPFEPSFYHFFYLHPFFAKVLVTFAFIYMIAPVILKFGSGQFGLIAHTVSVCIVYWTILRLTPDGESESLAIGLLAGLGSYGLKYSLLASLLIFLLGMLASRYLDASVTRRISAVRPQAARVAFCVLVVHAVLVLSWPRYHLLTDSKVMDPFVRAALVFAALLVVRYLLTIDRLRPYLTNQSILVIGQNSLTFFITSNLLLSLLTVPEAASMTMITRVIVVFTMIVLAYSVTKWRHAYSLGAKRAARMA